MCKSAKLHCEIDYEVSFRENVKNLVNKSRELTNKLHPQDYPIAAIAAAIFFPPPPPDRHERDFGTEEFAEFSESKP